MGLWLIIGMLRLTGLQPKTCGNWESASIDQLMSDSFFPKLHSALKYWGWCTDDQCLHPSDSFQAVDVNSPPLSVCIFFTL